MQVDLIFDITLIDHYEFVFVNRSNVLKACFSVFGEDVLEYSAFCGLGNVYGNQFVVWGIFVGDEVELRAVVCNACRGQLISD